MVKEIDAQETKRMMDSDDDVVVVDALGPDSFEKRHLPGAVNIPSGPDIETKAEEKIPDKSTPVVVYCADEECKASPTVAKKLDELGYEKVYDFEAGLRGWNAAGYEFERPGGTQQIQAET